MPIDKDVHTATIANSASLSDAIVTNDHWIAAVRPASGTEGTHIAFKRTEGSDDGYVRNADGTKFTVAFTAGDWTKLDGFNIPACGKIQVQTCSASDGTAQTQTGATTVLILTVGG